jgi:hypothetical protein
VEAVETADAIKFVTSGKRVLSGKPKSLGKPPAPATIRPRQAKRRGERGGAAFSGPLGNITPVRHRLTGRGGWSGPQRDHHAGGCIIEAGERDPESRALKASLRKILYRHPATLKRNSPNHLGNVFTRDYFAIEIAFVGTVRGKSWVQASLPHRYRLGKERLTLRENPSEVGEALATGQLERTTPIQSSATPIFI